MKDSQNFTQKRIAEIRDLIECPEFRADVVQMVEALKICTPEQWNSDSKLRVAIYMATANQFLDEKAKMEKNLKP